MYSIIMDMEYRIYLDELLSSYVHLKATSEDMKLQKLITSVMWIENSGQGSEKLQIRFYARP